MHSVQRRSNEPLQPIAHIADSGSRECGTLLLYSLSAALLLAMPRQARLDAPNTLHHVMMRGLKRRVIFMDDVDRADFVARLAALAEAGALMVYAWRIRRG